MEPPMYQVRQIELRAADLRKKPVDAQANHDDLPVEGEVDQT